MRTTFGKNHRTGDGQEVGALACPGSPFCPVTARDAWLAEADTTDGAVLHQVYRGRCVDKEVLQLDSVGKPVLKRIETVGFDDDQWLFSRSMFTEAAHSGADVFRLGAHSRHKNLDTLRRYVHREEVPTHHVGKTQLRGVRTRFGDGRTARCPLPVAHRMTCLHVPKRAATCGMIATQLCIARCTGRSPAPSQSERASGRR